MFHPCMLSKINTNRHCLACLAYPSQNFDNITFSTKALIQDSYTVAQPHHKRVSFFQQQCLLAPLPLYAKPSATLYRNILA